MNKRKLAIGLLLIFTLSTFTACSSANVGMQSIQQNQSSSNLEYYFTKANQHPDQQLIKIIDSSKKNLDIAIYSLTKKEIVDSIINAKKRGVIVRLITDKAESKSKYESEKLAQLKAVGIPVKINSHPSLMHLKLTIVDQNIATTGSYNYTQNASTENDEMLVVIKDSKVAKDFDSEFNNMWNDNKQYSDY